MLEAYINDRTFWIAIHIIGIFIGMGSAFAGDTMFLKSVQDGKITRLEMRRMHISGAVVWIGLAIITISGFFIFSFDVSRYLASPKFLAKMSIVGVIIANGVIFHTVHIPFLKRHMDMRFASSKEFMHRVPLLVISGAISMVSWLSAFTLGMLRTVSYSYGEIISIYLVVLVVVVITALICRKKVIPHQ